MQLANLYVMYWGWWSKCTLLELSDLLLQQNLCLLALPPMVLTFSWTMTYQEVNSKGALQASALSFLALSSLRRLAAPGFLEESWIHMSPEKNSHGMTGYGVKASWA